jgi:hypothetical protein
MIVASDETKQKILREHNGTPTPTIVGLRSKRAKTTKSSVKPWAMEADNWPFRAYYPYIFVLVNMMEREICSNWVNYTKQYTRSAFLCHILSCLTYGSEMWDAEGFFPETTVELAYECSIRKAVISGTQEASSGAFDSQYL